MNLQRYNKLWAALLAGLAVAIPSLVAAAQDNQISLQEWLTVLGLFLPAAVVGLSPANRLTTGDLVDQINKSPDVNLVNAEAQQVRNNIEDTITRSSDVRRVV
jgi:hypothetical protein